jgi:hypothetical protein
MKTHLALSSIAAALYLSAAYTRPETLPGQHLHNAIDTAVSKGIRYVQRLPYVRLLNWENEYQPRPTLRPLKVVPATDTPYTPEELAEIYPTY